MSFPERRNETYVLPERRNETYLLTGEAERDLPPSGEGERERLPLDSSRLGWLRRKSAILCCKLPFGSVSLVYDPSHCGSC